jgi:diguanylate cyclase (GGDEF)-like protein
MYNKLVLVVEDDAPIRMLLTELLQAGGLRVATLPDGERVLDVARESRPAAIVLDIGLPGKHGLAVLDELKEQPDLESIPVVVCSAWCDAGLVNRAMASGAFDYVNKPFAGTEVVQRVRAAMSAAEPPQPHELTDEVRRLMREDRLTGLPNRVGLEERFEERLAEAEITGEPIALVMVRIDSYEHVARWDDASASDLLVRMLSGELARRIRPGDAIGRFAEDTFLVVARRCDMHGAEHLADRMHAAAASVHARAGWTVSVGYCATDACGVDELLSSCDIALARAADAGGDRAVAGVSARHVGA